MVGACQQRSRSWPSRTGAASSTSCGSRSGRSAISSTRSPSASRRSRSTCASCATRASSSPGSTPSGASTGCAPSPCAPWTSGSNRTGRCGRRGSTSSNGTWTPCPTRPERRRRNHGRRNPGAARRPLAAALHAPARPPAGEGLASADGAGAPGRRVPARHRGRARGGRAAPLRAPRRGRPGHRGRDARVRPAPPARAALGRGRDAPLRAADGGRGHRAVVREHVRPGGQGRPRRGRLARLPGRARVPPGRRPPALDPWRALVRGSPGLRGAPGPGSRRDRTPEAVGPSGPSLARGRGLPGSPGSVRLVVADEAVRRQHHHPQVHRQRPVLDARHHGRRRRCVKALLPSSIPAAPVMRAPPLPVHGRSRPCHPGHKASFPGWSCRVGLTPPARPEAPPMQQSFHRNYLVRAIVAGTAGSAIEFYDFVLSANAAILIFPRVFFPHSDPLAGTLISFSTYSAGFISRPIGAAFFGHFGDRLGRKSTLVATLLLMGAVSVGVGLLPGYARIGIWGCLVLTGLRLLQGFAIGGEWGGTILLPIEWGPPNRRGFIGAWPHLGFPSGLLTSHAALIITSAVVGPVAFADWGWRIPFLLGGVLILFGFYVRLGVLETPPFTVMLEERRIVPRPVVEVFRRNWREVVLGALALQPVLVCFYLWATFALSYGTRTLKLDQTFMLTTTLSAAAVALVGVITFGALSDRVGYRRTYMTGLVVYALIAFPYYWLFDSRQPVLVVFASVAALVTFALLYGPLAAFVSSLYSGQV